MKSKKITSLALSLFLLLTGIFIPINNTQALVVGCPEYLSIGDFNEDGVSDASDASLILETYANTLTGGHCSIQLYQLTVGDVDKDGTISASDASLILEHYALNSTGVTATFPQAKINLSTTYTIPHEFEVIDHYGRILNYEAFTPFKFESLSNGVGYIVIGNSFYQFQYHKYTDDICIYFT